MFCMLSGSARLRWTTTTTTVLAFTRLFSSSCRIARPTLTMATHSESPEGGGRQYRRRKKAHASASDVRASGRKQSAKEVSSADGDEPHADSIGGRGEPSPATDLEERLGNLDKTDQLVKLTVVELRGLMKQMSRPTTGRKEELIGEVRKWLASRDAASARRQTTVDAARPVGDESSDGEAESLEETLLKAEGKSRQSDAVSKLTETLAGEELRKPSSAKPSGKKKSARGPLPNGRDALVAESGRGAISCSCRDALVAVAEGENSAASPEPVVDEAEVGIARKSRGRRKVAKRGRKGTEETVAEKGSDGPSKKRKTPVSRTGRSKKGKVTKDEGEEQEAVSNGGAELKDPWLRLVHKKCRAGWVAYDPGTMRPPPPPTHTKTMKLLSWNVNGLRALVNKGKGGVEEALHLTKLALEEDFDVLCLQETKLQEKDVEKVGNLFLSNYGERCWSCSTSKLGYSGTAVLSKSKPISIKYGMDLPDHDGEGRLITVEFDSFFLLASYVPNSSEKLKRLDYRTQEWDPALGRYIKQLEKSKPVVLTGDLNCAHEEIDIYNPDGNKRSAGFTVEERKSFEDNFLNQGLVDTFRRQHDNVVGYTYWGYRTGARPKNMGWRLDYFLVSESLMEKVHDSYIRPDVMGSDHCPIGLILKL